MASFGDKLREERERRGISLEEIAKATKVGPHLLEALERNDLASLPGGPFNKGFVRAYARHIGLDAEATIDEYGREERAQGLKTPDADRELLREMSRLIELRRDGERKTLVLDWSTVKRVGLAVLFVVVVAFGGWYWLTSGEPGDDTQTTASGAPAATAEPDATAASAAELPAGGVGMAARTEPAPTTQESRPGETGSEESRLESPIAEPAATTSGAESSPPTDSVPELPAAAANREPAGRTPGSGGADSRPPATGTADDLPEQTATATFGPPPERTTPQTTPPPPAEPRTGTPGAPMTGTSTSDPTAPGAQPGESRPEPAASRSTTPPPPPTPSRSLEIDSGSHITVADAGVGTRVSGRELVGRGDRFPEGARVYFWTLSTGGNPGDDVRHVWMRNGRYVVAYDLTIGGAHWRNWTRKTLSGGSVGRWTVEARDAEDRVLARVEFDCVPPAAP